MPSSNTTAVACKALRFMTIVSERGDRWFSEYPTGIWVGQALSDDVDKALVKNTGQLAVFSIAKSTGRDEPDRTGAEVVMTDLAKGKSHGSGE